MSGMDSIFRLSVILNMVDDLTSPLNDSSNQLAGTLGTLDSGFSSLIKVGSGMMAVGAGITGAVLSTVAATFDTQNALGELKSLGVEDLEAVEKAAKSFSDTWAGTTKADFITASYDIKSGIASLSDEGVAQFTELAALTGKATKSTTGEMSSLFATAYGIYKKYYSDLSDLEFGEMFSAGLSTAVRMYKTSGSEMASAQSRLGASATTANVPMEEQLAILGELQATMSGSEAGTKYKAFLKSAAKAGDELGLSFLDSNNQLRSMPEILAEIKGKYGNTIDAIEKQELAQAFGTDEAVSVIDLFYNKTGELENGILELYDAMGRGSDVATEMSEAINATESQKLTVLKQQISNTAEELGRGLLPSVNEFLTKLNTMMQKASTWAANNQETVTSIMKIVLGIGIFLMVAGGVMIVIGTIGKVVITAITIFRKLRMIFGIVQTGMLLLKTSILSAIPAVTSFGAALLANPITWVVVGVIALIAVIILLWKNWNKVTTFLKGAWNVAINGAKATLLKFIPAPIIKAWGVVTKFFGSLWRGVDKIFNGGLTNVKNKIIDSISWFKSSGAKVMSTFADGIKSAISKPVETVKGGLAKIRKMLPFSDAKEGPLSTLTLSGRRVFETIDTGMSRSMDLPSQTAKAGLKKVESEINNNNSKISNLSSRKKSSKSSSGNREKKVAGEFSYESKGNTTTINNLNINVSIKDLKDIKLLYNLLDEVTGEFNKSQGGVK